MELNQIVREFKKVNEKIEVVLSNEPNRWIIKTPYTFTDGKSILIVLGQQDGRWYLTDEQHTFEHLHTQQYRIAIFKTEEFRAEVERIRRLFRIQAVCSLLLVTDLNRNNCRRKLQRFIMAINKIIELCDNFVLPEKYERKRYAVMRWDG